MKQSTKLLSLVLALVMAFSCMTVIGNASLVKSEVKWDSVDDAALTPEQVADLALDLVDNDLLAGMDTIDLSIVGELRLDSVDHIAADIDELTSGFIWFIGKGLLGDVGDLNFDAIAGKQRSGGDLQFVYSLLQFLADNASILSKIAYGIGTSNGVSLGLIGNFLSLGDVEDLLADLPGFLVETVYDLLVYGSYKAGEKNDSYPSLEDLEKAGRSLPTEVNTLDKIVNNALLNLIIAPQDYTWEEAETEDGEDVKIWDTGSIILPSVKAWTEADGRDAVISNITPLSNSLFAILDVLAQFAIDDIAINALNNNLKKALMEAVEIDLNEIKESELPAAVAADFETTAVDGTESYVTYIAYDRMCSNGGAYYYTTMKTVPLDEDGDGKQDIDPETEEELTTKERKYYKANMASGNAFASLINWDWEFVGSSVATPAAGQVKLDYNVIKKDYDGDGTASIVEGINDLVKLVYDVALTDEVKADFEAFAGTGYVGGANSNIMTNVTNLTKYILVNFGELVFGKTSPYAHLTKEEVINKSVLDLVVMIGPGFFEDVMPQLIMPKNEDGTYAFHKGEELYEFGALILREFVTDIAPNVNYDAYIFEGGTVTSENGRFFKESVTVEQWFNLILNMGVDIGFTYLYNLTNFGDTFTYGTDGKSVTITKRGDNIYEALNDSTAYSADRWKAALNKALEWGVKYVGSQGSSSVLNGFDWNTVKGYSDPLDKLSYVLNKILPLGFINGYTTANFAFDISAFLNNGLKEFFKTCDISLILGLLGRNTKSYNILNSTNLVNAVLQLVNSILNLVFRANILNGVAATGSAQSIDAVVTQANLKTTVYTLLTALNSSKTALLLNALPVVGKLISGWGTEQRYKDPALGIERSVELSAGAGSNTLEVRNASDGVWRHYIKADGTEGTDNQYMIQVTDMKVYDGFTDTVSSTVTVGTKTTSKLDAGAKAELTYSVSGVAATGDLVRFEVFYNVFDENGAQLGGKTFKTVIYSYLNQNENNKEKNVGIEGEWNNWGTDSYATIDVFTDFFIDYTIDDLGSLLSKTRGYSYRKDSSSATKRALKATVSTPTTQGVTLPTGPDVNDRDAIDQTNVYFSLANESTLRSYLTSNGAGTKDVSLSWAMSLKAVGETADRTVKMHFYDGKSLTLLTDLVNKELNSNILLANYNLTGTVYANRLLRTANYTDEDGEIVYKETTSTATAWVDRDKNVYSASDVEIERTEYAEDTNTVTAVQKDGKYVTAQSGTVEVDGKNVDVNLVTALDAATVSSGYLANIEPAVRGALQCWNNQSVYNFRALYESIVVYANEFSFCKKTDKQILEEGNADNVDADIETLKAELNAIEAETIDIRDYRDYKMWRINRFNDARDDAHYYVDLKKDAMRKIDDIDTSFPYTGIEEDDLTSLVNLNEELQIKKDGQNIVLALLETLSEEEYANKVEWLDGRKEEYKKQRLIDVQMAANYLELTADRLLPKYDDVIDFYLDAELTSAENVIGLDNDGVYTERSWNRFIDAYDNAVAVYDDDSLFTQKHIFDVKYELQCARNELVKVEDEADYRELEDLIAQAEYALDNMDLYINEAADFGKVLAELGLADEDGKLIATENADGDTIQLFPGSAHYVNAEPYGKDQQDEIDTAARELKEALARLKFKGLDITGNGVSVDDEIIVPADEENEIEAVVAKVARIAAEMNEDAVKKLFTVTADDATVGEDNIKVSNDLNYSVDRYDEEGNLITFKGYAGTNSVVTFYTVQGGVKIPVATVKIVVNGDINGDGTVDVLDGSYAQLVSTEKAELQGCFFLAGNLDATANADNEQVINNADYGLIVNTIVA